MYCCPDDRPTLDADGMCSGVGTSTDVSLDAWHATANQEWPNGCSSGSVNLSSVKEKLIHSPCWMRPSAWYEHSVLALVEMLTPSVETYRVFSSAVLSALGAAEPLSLNASPRNENSTLSIRATMADEKVQPQEPQRIDDATVM